MNSADGNWPPMPAISARSGTITQEKSRNESSLALGIKLLSENENASGTVIAEELFIWRDVHWLSVPNKRKWPVPVEHVFVLGI